MTEYKREAVLIVPPKKKHVLQGVYYYLVASYWNYCSILWGEHPRSSYPKICTMLHLFSVKECLNLWFSFLVVFRVSLHPQHSPLGGSADISKPSSNHRGWKPWAVWKWRKVQCRCWPAGLQKQLMHTLNTIYVCIYILQYILYATMS